MGGPMRACGPCTHAAVARLPSASLFLLFLILLLSLAPSASAPSQRRPFAVGADAGATSDVVVVNDIASHFEVLAGVVHVLRQIGVLPRVLYAGRPGGTDDLGMPQWLGTQPADPAWVPIRHISDALPSAKLVMCISAEMAPQVCQELVTRLRPALLVIWVHRADTATPTAKILRMHQNYKLIALAPHVAALAQNRLRHPVTWDMPLAPYRPQPPCTALSCLNGFVVQGALRKYRNKRTRGFTRNYTQLWERMVELKRQQGQQRRVQVCVLGKGGFRSQLEIPAEVDGDVEYLEQLPYPDFWGRIHGSYALVPAFGMPVYYESRISSTILASLITGTPLIAEQRLLDIYTFLKPAHVFLRMADEDEVQAMYRILGMPERDVMAKRQALGALATELNAKSADTFRGMLREAKAAGFS